MSTQFAFSTTSLNTLEQYRAIVSKEAKDKAGHFGEGVYHSFKKFHLQAPLHKRLKMDKPLKPKVIKISS